MMNHHVVVANVLNEASAANVLNEASAANVLNEAGNETFKDYLSNEG